jgi:hypothetical protein
MRWHFHFKPIGDLVRIEPDRTPHAKKRNATVLDLFVQSSNANAEQIGQVFDGESFPFGSQLLNKSHFDVLTRVSLRCHKP